MNIKNIGTRHGEKLFEVLLSKEEKNLSLKIWDNIIECQLTIEILIMINIILKAIQKSKKLKNIIHIILED